MNVPSDEEFQIVNDGQGVAISLSDGSFFREDLVFLEEEGEYCWFIVGEGDGVEYQIPDEELQGFHSLPETIQDAINYIRQYPEEKDWQKRLSPLEIFLQNNQ